MLSSCSEICPGGNFRCLLVKHRASRVNINIRASCWYTEHSRSQQREAVFLFQKLRLTFPLNLMPRVSLVSQLTLPLPRRASPLRLTLCASLATALSSLSCVLWQPKPAGVEVRYPLGNSGTLILDFAVWRGSPVSWVAPRCSSSGLSKSFSPGATSASWLPSKGQM